MSNLLHTPLHATHEQLGARMVDFAGWHMPLHYGSQVNEHHAVRRAAGMFDVSHMLAIDISGSGACAFLRGLLANDVAKLRAPGAALYSCMLNPEGGVLDDLIVYLMGDGEYRVIVNAGTAISDVDWMTRQIDAGANVALTPRRDLALIAVQGPLARSKVWETLPHTRIATENLAPFHAAMVGRLLVARTGYTGEDGFELMLPAEEAEAVWHALAAAGVVPAGLGARDTLRLEAGMNLYGHDMDSTIRPDECGLAWTVALTPDRDFIGRAALAARVPVWSMHGLLLLGRGIMRNDAPVEGGGIVTSGGFSPTVNRSIGLARLPAGVRVERVNVRIRDAWLPAKVVRPPFVRNGSVRIDLGSESHAA